jgi:hypothetical protein
VRSIERSGTFQLGDLTVRRLGYGAGLLFTGLFFASVVTGAFVGPLASRLGHVSVIRGGLAFMSLG